VPDGLRVRTFGGVALYDGEQPVVALTSAKARALVVYLAITGRSQGRSALAGLLWSDLPERTARANLRLTLTKIRKALPGYLSTGTAIGLQSDRPIWVDAVELARHGTASDPALLAPAAALYTGEFLAGVSFPDAPVFEDWVRGERHGFHTLTLAVLDRLVQVARDRADYPLGIETARRIVALEPHHEDAHRSLMWFLAGNGQHNAALAQYQTCRHILVTDLGVEPAAATVALRDRIERATGFRDLDRPAEPPTAARARQRAAAAGPAIPLPAPSTGFVGRTAELAMLADWLADPACRIVTLVGPGGIGKTRLALAAAEQHRPAYRDGVAFASFVGSGESGPQAANLVVAGLAAAVGLPLEARRDPYDLLAEHLAERELLLVADNIENVRDGAAVLARVAAAAPTVRLLVTSRIRLGLGAEWVAEVSGLAVPPPDADAADVDGSDAVRLFDARARAVRAGFDLASQRATVARICRALVGGPLAIELAARWVRSVPPASIAEQLTHSIDLLATTAPDVPDRHRSLRTVLDRSWQLLDPDEQQVLAALAAFRGGFDLAAAERVAAATVPALTALVDHSMIRSEPGGRYTMHEQLRQYAEQRLTADPDAWQAAHHAHAEHFEQLASRLQPTFGITDEVEALEPDIENLRAATGWLTEHADAPRLAAHLDHMMLLYRARSWSREAVAFGRAALDRADADPVLRARWTRALGEAHLQLGELLTSRDELAEALALLGRRLPASSGHWLALLAALQLRRAWRRSPPSPEEAAAARERAWAALFLTETYYLLEERLPTIVLPLLSLADAERSGWADIEALGRVTSGLAAALFRLRGQASRDVDAALAAAEQSQDPLVVSYVSMIASLYRLGIAAWDGTEQVAARGVAVATANGMHRLADQSRLLAGIGCYLTGRYHESGECGHTSAAAGRERGDRNVELWGLLMQAEAGLRIGAPLAELDRTCAAARELLVPGVPRCDTVRAYAASAQVYLRQGDPVRCWQALRSAAEVAAHAPVVPQYSLPGFTGLAETALALRESGHAPDPHRLDDVIRTGLRRVREYAWLYPAGGPARLLLRGLLQWPTGRHRRALRSWAAAAREGQRLGLRYETARALYEIGRRLSAGRRLNGLTGTEHLDRARAAFAELGCAPDLAAVDASRAAAIPAGRAASSAQPHG